MRKSSLKFEFLFLFHYFPVRLKITQESEFKFHQNNFNFINYMCEKTKKFFYGFDLFGYVPSMRLRGQSDISSVCGGVTSMLVMGFFVYLFVVDMIDLANYGKI